MNTVNHNKGSFTFEGVDRPLSPTVAVSELGMISTELGNQISINWNLINDLKHSAGRLSSIKNLNEQQVDGDLKTPESVTETLRRQINELRDLNNTLACLVEHFNQTI